MASEILSELRKHPLAWTRCHQILQEASDNRTKFFALQVLDDKINTGWKVLPPEATVGVCSTHHYL